MCHHQKGASARGDEFERQLHHSVARSFVKIAGRLVREQQTRPRGQRPANGDSLLLAAGKLFGIARGEIARPRRLVNSSTHRASRRPAMRA